VRHAAEVDQLIALKWRSTAALSRTIAFILPRGPSKRLHMGDASIVRIAGAGGVLCHELDRQHRAGWRLFAAVNSPWLRFLVG
jgi:hypothetical protein